MTNQVHPSAIVDEGAQIGDGSGVWHFDKQLRSCNLSVIACTSFFPSKPLGCYGDGGAIFTNDDEVARVIRQIARHGQDRRYHHVRVGVKSRLDTLQAAVLLPKLEILENELHLRKHGGRNGEAGAEPADASLPAATPTGSHRVEA